MDEAQPILGSTVSYKGRTIIPLGGGGGEYRDQEKIVCMTKIAEINCLPRGASEKTLSAETTPVLRDLGIFLNVCTASGGKKFASAQSMVEKHFLLPRNHDTSTGEK